MGIGRRRKQVEIAIWRNQVLHQLVPVVRAIQTQQERFIRAIIALVAVLVGIIGQVMVMIRLPVVAMNQIKNMPVCSTGLGDVPMVTLQEEHIVVREIPGNILEGLLLV